MNRFSLILTKGAKHLAKNAARVRAWIDELKPSADVQRDVVRDLETRGFLTKAAAAALAGER